MEKINDCKIMAQILEDHKISDVETHKGIYERLSFLEKEIGKKVNWTVFWSIVSVLIPLNIVVWGGLYEKIEDVQKNMMSISSDVSYIRGILDDALIE